MQKNKITMGLAVVIAVVLAFWAYPALGTDRLVPGQYATIQAAIDAAVDHDRIIVAPGTYQEDITVSLKNLSLASVDPDDPNVVASTIIHGTGSNSVVIFSNIVGQTQPNIYCRMTGFTITGGGAGQDGGGGIYIGWKVIPSISHCVIMGNHTTGHGGGIWATEGNGIINRCVIANNTAVGNGGGIYNFQGKIINSLIVNNQANYNGGIFFGYPNKGKLYNCTIVNNTNTSGLSGSVLLNGEVIVRNCIVWGNVPENVRLHSLFTGSISNSCWPEAAMEDGNINSDPGFVSSTDFHLAGGSLCIDAGVGVSAGGLLEVDLEGVLRPQDGDRNGSEIFDMGAYEYPGPAKIMMKKPVGGEVWVSGSTHKIEWLGLNYSGTIDLSYSINGGADWLPMVSGISNSGSYAWTVPAVESEDCLVSIAASVTDPEILYEQIDEPFAIHASPAGEAVESHWRMAEHDGRRSGLAEFAGPEFGCLKWLYHIPSPMATGVVVGADDNLHFACEDGKLYTIDPNGAAVWQYDTGSVLGGMPAVGQDGSVYFGAEDGRIYALDKDGNLRWTHKTESMVFSSPAVADNGELYIGSLDSTLYALGADGSELWRFTIPATGSMQGSIVASPTVGLDGKVYIGSIFHPTLYALNAADGSIAWQNTLSGDGICSSPVVGADGTIYLVTTNSKLLQAINPANGAVLWTVDLADNTSGLYEGGETRLSQKTFTEPAIGPDGTIYVSFEDPYLRAVNPDGTIKWVSRLGMGQGFNLTVDSGGRIYAAGADSSFYIVESDEGRIVSLLNGLLYNIPGLFTHYNIPGLITELEILGPDGYKYVANGPTLLPIAVYDPNDNYMYGIDLGTKMSEFLAPEQWLYSTARIMSLGMIDNDYLYVLAKSSYFVGKGGRHVIVYNLNTENVVDVISVPFDYKVVIRPTPIFYPVIAGNGVLYLSDYQHFISAIASDDCGDKLLSLRHPYDFDSDREVDFLDYAKLLSTWCMCSDYDNPGECVFVPNEYSSYFPYYYNYTPGGMIYPMGDINRDLYVNFDDLVLLAERWLEGY